MRTIFGKLFCGNLNWQKSGKQMHTAEIKMEPVKTLSLCSIVSCIDGIFRLMHTLHKI